MPYAATLPPQAVQVETRGKPSPGQHDPSGEAEAVGVFNTIVGEVPCPSCGGTAKLEHQFKWANDEAVMEDFYVGERIPGAPPGVHWEEGDGFPSARCEGCGK